MQTLRIMMEARGMSGMSRTWIFLQADNQMSTFAKETGGQAYFPRFQGEYPEIFQQIHQALRSQYVITLRTDQQEARRQLSARSRWSWSIRPPTSLCR